MVVSQQNARRHLGASLTGGGEGGNPESPANRPRKIPQSLSEYRGAPRLRRGAPSVGGVGGPCRGPPFPRLAPQGWIRPRRDRPRRAGRPPAGLPSPDLLLLSLEEGTCALVGLLGSSPAHEVNDSLAPHHSSRSPPQDSPAPNPTRITRLPRLSLPA